jgi:hypothetical protein
MTPTVWQGYLTAFLFLFFDACQLVSTFYGRGNVSWVSLGLAVLLTLLGAAFLLSTIALRRRLGPDAD